MIDIEKLTVGEVKEITRMFACPPQVANQSEGRWRIGSNYFIRTVTHHLLGRLEAVTPQELWLSSVSWIANDGRFNEFLKYGKANEVEPAPEGDVAVGRGSLIDAYLWHHALLREVK